MISDRERRAFEDATYTNAERGTWPWWCDACHCSCFGIEVYHARLRGYCHSRCDRSVRRISPEEYAQKVGV